MRRVVLCAAMLTLGLALARTARGWFPVRVAGGSMQPTLRPGDLLAVRPCADGEPLRGRIVVVRRGDLEMVKRVVAVSPERGLADGMVWLEGDAAHASTDSRTVGPMPRDDIVGVVVARYWPLVRARVFVARQRATA